MHSFTSVLKYCAEVFVEESHQLFGFLRLLPRLYSLSLHRSSNVLPRCLSLFACDPGQLLLYNGLLLLIPVQAHTDLFICLLPSHDSLTAVLKPTAVFCSLFLCSFQLWFTLGENPGKSESHSYLQSYPLRELQYLVLIFMSYSLDICVYCQIRSIINDKFIHL